MWQSSKVFLLLEYITKLFICFINARSNPVFPLQSHQCADNVGLCLQAVEMQRRGAGSSGQIGAGMRRGYGYRNQLAFGSLAEKY